MSKSTKTKSWIPIESNPDLMNKYIHELGVDPKWSFHDVLGTDDDLLQMVPQPVVGVLLLFPVSENSENHSRQQQEELEAKQAEAASASASENSSETTTDKTTSATTTTATTSSSSSSSSTNSSSDAPYYTLQTVGNACGTIGLIHCIFNNLNKIKLTKDSFFDKFYNSTKSLSPAERASALEKDDEIEISHQALASEASSDVNNAVNDNLHFAAFVNVAGRLYELDGRKKQAIDHGETSDKTLLKDSVKIIKEFIARDPTDLRFNMTALTDQESAF